MYCPQCGREFREGLAECPGCHVPLQAGTQADLVTVLECGNSVQLGLAEGTLEEAGIPYLLNGQRFGPTSKTRAFMAFTGDVPFRLQVARDRATEAHALLAHLAEP
jgi:hypothetical protein